MAKSALSQPRAVDARSAVLFFVGFATGLSGLWGSWFDISAWGPVGVLLVAGLSALLAGGPQRLNRGAWVALASLAGLAVLAMASGLWAESDDRVLVDGSRLIVYAVALAVLVMLTRSARTPAAGLAGLTAGIGVVALYAIARMAVGDGGALMIAGRLHEPLGYFNGQGALFLAAIWPLVAVVELRRSRAEAACAIGAATILFSLVLASQSRGALIALGVTALAVLLLAPTRIRIGWNLAVVGAGSALTLPVIADLAPSGSVASDGDMRVFALLAVAGAGLSAGLWAAAAGFLGGGSGLAGRIVRTRGRLSLAAALVGIAAATGLLAPRVGGQLDEFLESRPAAPDQVRLLSGTGNRGEFWRVAVREFGRHPAAGVGAGNFPRIWFRDRRTTEDVRQPHSLLLQTLVEMGLLGGALLTAFVLPILAAAVVMLRRGIPLGVAAAGVVGVWLMQTSVDWLHLLPGITTGAMAAGAVLLTRPGVLCNRPELPLGRVARYAGMVAVVLAAVTIARATLADRLADSAAQRVASEPRRAIELARDSLSFNGDSLRAIYARAAAEARLGSYESARNSLRSAIDREPRNFLSWALLGDLASRRGDLPLAAKAYGRAAALNPLDPTLSGLRRDARLALDRKREVAEPGPRPSDAE